MQLSLNFSVSLLLLSRPKPKMYWREMIIRRRKSLTLTLNCLVASINWIWERHLMDITIQSSKQIHNLQKSLDTINVLWGMFITLKNYFGAMGCYSRGVYEITWAIFAFYKILQNSLVENLQNLQNANIFSKCFLLFHMKPTFIIRLLIGSPYNSIIWRVPLCA